jgi:hypothetical protein
MFLINLIFIFIGYHTEKLWPEGIVKIASGTAVLLAISLTIAANNPYVDRSSIFQPAAIGYNLLLKLIIVAIFFMVGFGIARWRVRKSTDPADLH